MPKRAGFRCSFPGCGKITVGPGQKSEEVDSTGVAAHILASAGGGPRGTGGLSVEDRKHPKNGIWMCNTHSTLIDVNTGKRYPDGVIQGWKASHEARIDHEHHRLPVPFGWMSQLLISKSPLFASDTVIDFGKVTLLFGSNGTGKTAVCDWLLAMLGGMPYGCRWMHRWNDRDEVVFRLSYATPDPHIATGIISMNTIAFKIDGKFDALDISHSLASISLQKDFRFNDIDDLSNIAEVLGVHRQRVAQAISQLGILSLPFIKNVIVEDVTAEDLESEGEDESLIDKQQLYRLGITRPQKIRVQIGSHPKPFSFNMLSGSEVSITIFSIAIALAHLRGDLRSATHFL